MDRTHTAERDAASDPLLALLIIHTVGGHLGREPGWAQRVDAHPSPRPLGRQLARQAHQTVLAGDVGGLRHLADADQPEDRRDVDDGSRAALEHVDASELRQSNGRDQVDIDDGADDVR